VSSFAKEKQDNAAIVTSAPVADGQFWNILNYSRPTRKRTTLHEADAAAVSAMIAEQNENPNVTTGSPKQQQRSAGKTVSLPDENPVSTESPKQQSRSAGKTVSLPDEHPVSTGSPKLQSRSVSKSVSSGKSNTDSSPRPVISLLRSFSDAASLIRPSMPARSNSDAGLDKKKHLLSRLTSSSDLKVQSKSEDSGDSNDSIEEESQSATDDVEDTSKKPKRKPRLTNLFKSKKKTDDEI